MTKVLLKMLGLAQLRCVQLLEAEAGTALSPHVHCVTDGNNNASPSSAAALT